MGRVVWTVGWLYKPTWHWFNHRNKNYNLKASSLNGNVVWRTVREVDVGEELTWQYNTPRNMKERVQWSVW